MRSSCSSTGDARRRRACWIVLVLLAAPAVLPAAADAAADAAALSSSLRDAAPFLRALEISGANGMKSALQQGDVFLQDPKLMRLYSNLGNNAWAATLLWPSDMALDSFARGAGCTRDSAVAALTAQPGLFWKVLSAHIVEGSALTTSNFSEHTQLQALDGGVLVLRKNTSGRWLVNGASISQPDVLAGRAVLHVVDALVQPASHDAWQYELACAGGQGGAQATLSPGARIGISVGVSAGLALLLTLAMLAVVMVRRRRRRQQAQDPWATGGAPKTIVAAAAATSASRWRRSRGWWWRLRRAFEQIPLPRHAKDALGGTTSRSTPQSSSDDSVQQVHVVCAHGSSTLKAAGSRGDTVLCMVGSGALIAPIPAKDGDESSDDGEHGANTRVREADLEQGAAVEDTAGAALAAAFAGHNKRVQQGGDSLYPTIPGSLLPQPNDPAPGPAVLTPAVTQERLDVFLAQWESAGSAGGRMPLPILPLFSEVVPPGGAGAAQAATDDMEQLHGCFAVVQAKGRVQETSPLLQQVLADLSSGRHPVTHNFSMDEQHAPIARPNTAVVFATNNNNHKRVCIKFYAPRSPGYRAETSAYYRLASRHLPFLESTFTDKDGSYASALVMEAGDRSLRELLAERRPTDLPRKVELLHQLVLNVRALHINNIVHRQLHPRHVVFYSDSLAWKLIDFGQHVFANAMVVPEVFSLEYTAPEVAAALARGDRGVVACTASDMWSLGVIAYELATGQPFWPLTWSNEDIWRALLGLAPLPSERADMAAAAAPGEKAIMKKVANLLQRDPCKRMSAERLASSRLFSVCAATTTNVPLHAMQQQQLAGSASGGGNGGEGGSELFRRLGSINRTLERLGLQVDRGNSLGVNILKELTMNSLILSVNLQELRPHTPLAAQAAPCKRGSHGAPAESVPGEELGSGEAKLCAVQVGALGLVAKSPAPLVDDGSGSPVFYLRQGSSYLVELTLMHAKGQALPDQASVESCVIESPDGKSMPLQLGPTCRGRSQLMVSAIFNPAASKSKLVAGVTPRRLWGRREASVPLSLSICLSMCLLPDAAPAPAGGNLDVGRAGSCASMASAAGSSVFGGSSAASFARRASSSASRSVTSGPSASGTSYHSCLSTQQQQPQVLDGACSQLEQAWVQTELAVRVFPAETSFKAVRTFRYLDECWQALPPEARGVMQGLVLLVRGAAGGAAALASMIR